MDRRGADVAEPVDARDLKADWSLKNHHNYLKSNILLSLNELHNHYTNLDFGTKSAYAYAYVYQP